MGTPNVAKPTPEGPGTGVPRRTRPGRAGPPREAEDRARWMGGERLGAAPLRCAPGHVRPWNHAQITDPDPFSGPVSSTRRPPTGARDEGELRALARVALHLDRALVQIDDALSRWAQPRGPVARASRRRPSRLDAVEAIEDPRQLLVGGCRGAPCPRTLTPHARRGTCSTPTRTLPPRVRVADGVVDEVCRSRARAGPDVGPRSAGGS